MRYYFPLNNRGAYLYIGYHQYFYPEISSFFEKDKYYSFNSNDSEDIYKEKRQNGESDNYICELIRKDSIDEFITFVNKTNLDITQGFRYMDLSIYETN
ncbi:hypothetical protein M9Y10_030770 [Tritrichomonas musculus]|uniref:Uncharacterized protein n=1 Tax=Tritrichomonas musculus TaxID=1915356 RepID=A0ABR2H3Z6_9EUKA